MKTTDNFVSQAPRCALCKHAYKWGIAHYCNQDGTCPCRTQREFDTVFSRDTEDKASFMAWMDLHDQGVQQVSERYVGHGDGVCDKFERAED